MPRVSKTLPPEVKKALAQARAKAQEDAFRANLKPHGWAKYETEYVFHPTRKWRFDFCWPGRRVAVEKDGGVWTRGKHGRGSGIVKDHEKQNAAAVLGWRILRCTPSQLATPEFAETVVDALNYRDIE